MPIVIVLLGGVEHGEKIATVSDKLDDSRGGTPEDDAHYTEWSDAAGLCAVREPLVAIGRELNEPGF